MVCSLPRRILPIDLLDHVNFLFDRFACTHEYACIAAKQGATVYVRHVVRCAYVILPYVDQFGLHDGRK